MTEILPAQISDRARGHQHRPGQVLGQARRRPQPARGRQPVADPRRSGQRNHRSFCPDAAGQPTAVIACSSPAPLPSQIRGPRAALSRSGASPRGHSSCRPRSRPPTPCPPPQAWHRRRPGSRPWPWRHRARRACTCHLPSSRSSPDEAPALRHVRSSAASPRCRPERGRRQPTPSRASCSTRTPGTFACASPSPPRAKRPSARPPPWSEPR
jgi:hypothetical protein